MRKIMMVGMLLVFAMLAVGCAGMMGESGIRNKMINITNVDSANNNVIYYSPILYDNGFTRWNVVTNERLKNPGKYHLEFKKILVKEIERVFKERGYALVEKNPPSNSNSIYIELRISLWGKESHPRGVSGTRWLVYQGDKLAFEIYYWTFGTYDEMAKILANKATDSLLDEIKRK